MSRRILISILFASLIFFAGCESGSNAGSTIVPASKNKASQPVSVGASLNEKIYKINYHVGYKAGAGASNDDKQNNHSYSPETILANPLIQSYIRTISDQAVEHFGEAYRADAERGYKDGFLAGYKDGFN